MMGAKAHGRMHTIANARVISESYTEYMARVSHGDEVNFELRGSKHGDVVSRACRAIGADARKGKKRSAQTAERCEDWGITNARRMTGTDTMLLIEERKLGMACELARLVLLMSNRQEIFRLLYILEGKVETSMICHLPVTLIGLLTKFGEQMSDHGGAKGTDACRGVLRLSCRDLDAGDPGTICVIDRRPCGDARSANVQRVATDNLS